MIPFPVSSDANIFSKYSISFGLYCGRGLLKGFMKKYLNPDNWTTDCLEQKRALTLNVREAISYTSGWFTTATWN